VHAPYEIGAYIHPINILAAGGGAEAFVGLGEGKKVGVAVFGVAVVGAVAVAATESIQDSLHNMHTAASSTTGSHQEKGTAEYPASAEFPYTSPVEAPHSE
jgi:hypothetical protein